MKSILISFRQYEMQFGIVYSFCTHEVNKKSETPQAFSFSLVKLTDQDSTSVKSFSFSLAKLTDQKSTSVKSSPFSLPGREKWSMQL